MQISHRRPLWVGHHLDVDVIHRASVQAVQFHASKHAAGQKHIKRNENKNRDLFLQKLAERLMALLSQVSLPFPTKSIHHGSVQQHGDVAARHFCKL